MPFFDPIRIGASGAVAADYTVDRSLRFNDDDSPILTRTPSSTGTEETWTYSCWVKRSNLDTYQGLLAVGTGDGSEDFFGFHADNKLYFRYSSSSDLKTNALYRDISAWLHIVVIADTTQSQSSSTASDSRLRLYVNGEQITSFEQSDMPSQGHTFRINTTGQHYIGEYPRINSHLDGYLAEINFIDGQAYDPSYFAETNAITGQWNPKKYTGSYGTNGFYLNFSDNSGTTATTLGKDSSGNGNNFTPNNFSVADGIDGDSFADTPTNNFCTLNPLVRSQSAQSLANGNLQRSGTARKCVGTFVLKNNKYYFEVKVEDGNGNAAIGVTQADTDLRDRDNTEAAAYFPNGEYKIEGSGQTSGFSTYGNGDIIGVAIDTTLSTPKVWFAKNNTWQGTGDPSTTGYSLTAGKDYVFNIDHGSSGSSTTATAFFGGHKGEFNYTPPTGFVAASSANLPDPTILLPNKHFDTLLYSGTGSSNSITGLNFAPDWVWVKRRNAAGNHHLLIDQVRGGDKSLSSNLTDAENSNANRSMTFNSNGVTWNSDTGNANASGGTYVLWNWDAGETDGKTYTVTVVDDSGNKYRFDGFGTSAVTLDLAEGGTYIFNYPSAHPLKFSTTADGTHGGGSEYTTGVTHNSSTQVTIVVAASAPQLYYYCSIHSGMGGAVNTNSTLGSSNFDGTGQATVKTNTSSGFSIVTYTGNATGSPTSAVWQTIGHGLGVTPQVIIMKSRSYGDADTNWATYHHKVTDANTDYLKLNATEARVQTDVNYMGSTLPTSSVFSLGYNFTTNKGSEDYVAYCFSEVSSYSKFGSYVGNGNSDGVFVFTGFRPAWVMIKRSSATSSSSGWFIFDNKRNTFNQVSNKLCANSSQEENDASTIGTGGANDIDFLSNGFKPRATNGGTNASSNTYIYFAFAESPFKNARAR